MLAIKNMDAPAAVRPSSTWTDIIFLVNRFKAPYTVIKFENGHGFLFDYAKGETVARTVEEAETVIRRN